MNDTIEAGEIILLHIFGETHLGREEGQWLTAILEPLIHTRLPTTSLIRIDFGGLPSPILNGFWQEIAGWAYHGQHGFTKDQLNVMLVWQNISSDEGAHWQMIREMVKHGQSVDETA